MKTISIPDDAAEQLKELAARAIRSLPKQMVWLISEECQRQADEADATNSDDNAEAVSR